MELPPRYDTLIRDCDLYGELEPWQIWEYYKGKDNNNKDDHDDEEEVAEEDMFFFTQLKKKSANGSRISRTVGYGGGAWQSEDTAKKVLPSSSSSSSSTENVLGFKKRFRYENKSNPEHDGDWIMFEYSLDPSLLESPDQPNDYVLCRIKKNNVNAGKKKRKSKRSQEDHQVQVNNMAEEDRQVYEEIDHGDSQSQLLGLMTTNFWNHDYNTQTLFF
ncbi:hypothetical protein LWI28_021359 [Acer negundo]|uniref:NAC domain-containing protein n=1 Tax=Acer negundo TaxID=4023 RepID=A0AAD5IGC0_ACENE|nr:hypothetical protein LWI28_021359 [Acer negundo]